VYPKTSPWFPKLLSDGRLTTRVCDSCKPPCRLITLRKPLGCFKRSAAFLSSSFPPRRTPPPTGGTSHDATSSGPVLPSAALIHFAPASLGKESRPFLDAPVFQPRRRILSPSCRATPSQVVPDSSPAIYRVKLPPFRFFFGVLRISSPVD